MIVSLFSFEKYKKSFHLHGHWVLLSFCFFVRFLDFWYREKVCLKCVCKKRRKSFPQTRVPFENWKKDSRQITEEASGAVSRVQSGNEAERVRFRVDPRARSGVLASIVGNGGGGPAMHIGAVHHRRLKRYVIFNSRSISWPNRGPTRPTGKNACRPPLRFCRVASGKSGGSYIYRPSTLPRVSLTIRGQPPARVPSTLPTYVCIYAKTHFHLFFSLFFSLCNRSRNRESDHIPLF